MGVRRGQMAGCTDGLLEHQKTKGLVTAGVEICSAAAGQWCGRVAAWSPDERSRGRRAGRGGGGGGCRAEAWTRCCGCCWSSAS